MKFAAIASVATLLPEVSSASSNLRSSRRVVCTTTSTDCVNNHDVEEVFSFSNISCARGCPGSCDVRPDQRDYGGFYVSFGQDFKAHAEGDKTWDSQSCDVFATVNIEAGKQIKIISALYQGEARVPADEGSGATFTARYNLADERGEVVERVFEPGYTNDNGGQTYEVSDEAELEVWSECGGIDDFRASLGLTAKRASTDETDVFVSLSFADLDVDNEEAGNIRYNVEIRDCEDKPDPEPETNRTIGPDKPDDDDPEKNTTVEPDDGLFDDKPPQYCGGTDNDRKLEPNKYKLYRDHSLCHGDWRFGLNAAGYLGLWNGDVHMWSPSGRPKGDDLMFRGLDSRLVIDGDKHRTDIQTWGLDCYDKLEKNRAKSVYLDFNGDVSIWVNYETLLWELYDQGITTICPDLPA